MSNEELSSSIDQSKTDTVGEDKDPSASEEKLLDFTRTGSSELGRQLSLGGLARIPERIGLYRIVALIGEGGMGAVCLAEQTEPIRRQVALKLIKGGNHCSSEIITRFEAERQALAMMDHPNIAKILDGGQSEEGIPFFVMELVKGVPLTEYCDREKLTIRERLELFLAVCRAVHHAHQKGVIHRDLKPSNVLVAIHDDRPVAKVIDFGLAKAIDRSNILGNSSLETEFGQLLGTIRYMSPEQADLHRSDIDTRTDIYSLGVILYELLTGTTPLDHATLKRESKFRLLELIRETNPPRPSDRLSLDQDSAIDASTSRQIGISKLQSLLRGELDWIVMKALEIDRNRRYETANSFAEDIQRYLEGRAVKARPPSTWYRIQKLARQHSKVAATLLLIITTLVCATAISFGLWVEAEHAKEKAEISNEKALREKDAQQTVTNIMQQVFDAGDPILGRLLSKYGSEFGQETSIARVVRQVAEEELGQESQLKDFPLMRASLLNSLGDICLSSGDVKFAFEVFQKSNALLLHAQATGSADYAKSLMALGTCDYLLGNLESSKERLQKFLKCADCLSEEERERQEVIRDRAFGCFVLAGVYIEEEDFDKTYELFEQVAEFDAEGARDLSVLADLTRIFTTLVTAYEMRVNEEVTVAGIRKILAFTVAGFWSFDVQDTLAGPFRGAVLAELASLVGISPYDAYQEMHGELVEATSEKHFLTLLPQFGMALAAERFEDFESADKNYKAVIELADATLGREHPRFGMVLQRYANLKFRIWSAANEKNIEILADAKKHCKEALELRQRKLGVHRLTAESFGALGQIESASNDYASAAQHLESAIRMQQDLGREVDSHLIFLLADAAYQLGNYSRAEESIAKLLDRDRKYPIWWFFGDPDTARYQLLSAKIQFKADEGTLGQERLEGILELTQRSIRGLRPISLIAIFSKKPEQLMEAEQLQANLEAELAIVRKTVGDTPQPQRTIAE